MFWALAEFVGVLVEDLGLPAPLQAALKWGVPSLAVWLLWQVLVARAVDRLAFWMAARQRRGHWAHQPAYFALTAPRPRGGPAPPAADGDDAPPLVPREPGDERLLCEDGFAAAATTKSSRGAVAGAGARRRRGGR